jgi:metal-responsive CopG/Arc/MetJ family transcriptional regulator
MKSHISATIDDTLLEELNRLMKEERRSRSQIIEIALEAYLRARSGGEETIVTSAGCFAGNFNREETYAR